MLSRSAWLSTESNDSLHSGENATSCEASSEAQTTRSPVGSSDRRTHQNGPRGTSGHVTRSTSSANDAAQARLRRRVLLDLPGSEGGRSGTFSEDSAREGD